MSAEAVSLGVNTPKDLVSIAQAQTNTKKHTQTVMVEIKGSLGGFHMIGPDAATWRPMEVSRLLYNPYPAT